MLYVDNGHLTDPRINLAIEEFLLRHVQVDEPLLLFYVNEPSVIIGRNQNALEEIDPLYVKENDIHLVRRLSGGGAVYHDLGNLNFSFVTPGQQGLHTFDRFTAPIIQVLHNLGVDAQLRNRSAIFVGDKKISGNAQYASRGRMFSHGTLLFDSNIEMMLKAINPRKITIESKAVQSVRSFVANIRELMPHIESTEKLQQALLSGIFAPGPIQHYNLSTKDWQQIQQISNERYKTWEWNVGRSPRFNVQKNAHFPMGKVDVHIGVNKGLIQDVKIYSDFFGKEDIDSLEALLKGVRYDPDALEHALDRVEINQFFGDLTRTEFLQLIY